MMFIVGDGHKHVYVMLSSHFTSYPQLFLIIKIAYLDFCVYVSSMHILTITRDP